MKTILKSLNQIEGLDTETYQGKAILIATSKEYHEPTSFLSILKFLNSYSKRTTIYFTFNLRYDAQAILKWINDIELLEQLFYSNTIEYESYKIKYIPKKFLSISTKGGSVYLYDIAQYYLGYNLNNASKKYLGKSKMEDIDPEQIQNDYEYYLQNRNKIIQYCRQDALLTKELTILMKEYYEKTGFSFRNPVSQAKISELFVRDHYKIPKISKSIEKYHKIAELSYFGGIFATLKRGLFNKTLYSYDINSAYPDKERMLPNWNNGEFVKVKEPNTHNSFFGWYLCSLNSPFIPYRYRGKPYEIEISYDNINYQDIPLWNYKIIYPKGLRTQVITKAEYDFLKKHNQYVYFLEGFEWIPNGKKEPSPFNWIEDTYYQRKEIKRKDKEDPKQMVLKHSMNGIYGKTAQHKKLKSSFTNFFYSSYITALTRIQIWEAALSIGLKHIYEIATDSILCDKQIPNLPISEKLGEWEKKEYSSALLIGSGMRQTWNENGEFKTNARGLTDKHNWNMLSDIIKHQDKDHIIYTQRRPIQLGEILTFNKILNPSDLNIFKPVYKRLNVNTDTKWNWSKEYLDFKDLLENKTQAEPYDMEQLYVKERTKELEKIEKREKERAKWYIKHTDLYEPDKTLKSDEKIEDAKREMMRWIRP